MGLIGYIQGPVSAEGLYRLSCTAQVPVLAESLYRLRDTA